MKRPAPDLTGQRFGMLTVVRLASHDKYIRYEVRCDCGVVKPVLSFNLVRRIIRSCGCARRMVCPNGHERAIHGQNKYGVCRECRRQNVKNWVKRNRPKRLEYRRRYYRANAARLRASAREYYLAHVDRQRCVRRRSATRYARPLVMRNLRYLADAIGVGVTGPKPFLPVGMLLP